MPGWGYIKVELEEEKTGKRRTIALFGTKMIDFSLNEGSKTLERCETLEMVEDIRKLMMLKKLKA